MASLFAPTVIGKSDDPFAGSFTDIELLPDFEKERICTDLLSEFGASVSRVNDQGEMIHSCILPFGLHAHGDRNPSASLNYKRLTYNCYACGGGGLLWLIATCRGTSTADARKWVGTQSGTGADEQSLSSLMDFFDAVYSDERRRKQISPIPHMDIRVLQPYLKIHPYMTEMRGCSEDVLKHFMVGFGDFRYNLGSPEDEMWIDSPRIVIPHFWDQSLVGWQTRRLLDDGTPKYLNTPDFPRDTTLYNYSGGREPLVIVESTVSVLKHADRHRMTATFGSEVTEAQLRLLGKTERAILWFDNDPAGWKATEDVGRALSDYTTVMVVDSDWAADAGDMDAGTADQLIADAIPYPLWIKPKALRKWGTDG